MGVLKMLPLCNNHVTEEFSNEGLSKRLLTIFP